MMDFIKWIFQLIFFYEKDKAAGKPYWQDPAFVGLVVSIAGTELAKYAGMTIGPDLQLKIVGVVTGIGALLSPHTGVVQKKPPNDGHSQKIVPALEAFNHAGNVKPGPERSEGPPNLTQISGGT